MCVAATDSLSSLTPVRANRRPLARIFCSEYARGRIALAKREVCGFCVVSRPTDEREPFTPSRRAHDRNQHR